jgi:eukaryotic-like serine/threonine-protein kinase
MDGKWKYIVYVAAFICSMMISTYATTRFIVRSQPEVDVPDLVGLDSVTALKTLSDLGLNLKVDASDYNDVYPKGHVCGQDPPVGSRLKKRRDVVVILSKGSAQVTLPDLKGLSLEQARTIIEQSRLTFGQISYMYGVGPESGRDRVLAQTPEALMTVPVGSTINLLLSRGPRPEWMLMPDLTGLVYTRAADVIEEHGFIPGRIESDARPSWPVEAVLVQEPSPGSRVARGELVRLTVNRKEDIDQETYRWELLEYKVPYGLFPCEIRFRVAVGSYLWDVYEGWHRPGERVRLLAPVNGPIQARVFEDGDSKAIKAWASRYWEGAWDDQISPLDPVSRLFPPG